MEPTSADEQCTASSKRKRHLDPERAAAMGHAGGKKSAKKALDSKRASLMGEIGAQMRLVNTTRQERSQAGRRGWEDVWMRKADPEGVLSVAERARKAEALQKAHMAKMTLARWSQRSAKPKKGQ